jgi:hypothetical protein
LENIIGSVRKAIKVTLKPWKDSRWF